jgi:hypothetical protein
MTFEKMEGFSFVAPVTGLNTPNTGTEDDDDDDLLEAYRSMCLRKQMHIVIFHSRKRISLSAKLTTQ